MSGPIDINIPTLSATAQIVDADGRPTREFYTLMTEWGRQIKAAGAAIPEPFSGSYDDLTDTPTLGTAAAKDTGTTNGTVPLIGSGNLLPASIVPAVPPNTKSYTAVSDGVISFSSIPSGVRRIQLALVGITADDVTGILVQLGTSGGYKTSGYVGGSGYSTSAAIGIYEETTGFRIANGAANRVLCGIVELVLADSSSNRWVSSHTLFGNVGTIEKVSGGGHVSLDGELNSVRLIGRTDTITAGSANILYS